MNQNEGYPITKKPPSWAVSFGRVILNYSLEWWWEADSNHRRVAPADLQSAPVGHLGIPPDL